MPIWPKLLIYLLFKSLKGYLSSSCLLAGSLQPVASVEVHRSHQVTLSTGPALSPGAGKHCLPTGLQAPGSNTLVGLSRGLMTESCILDSREKGYTWASESATGDRAQVAKASRIHQWSCVLFSPLHPIWTWCYRERAGWWPQARGTPHSPELPLLRENSRSWMSERKRATSARFISRVDTHKWQEQRIKTKETDQEKPRYIFKCPKHVTEIGLLLYQIKWQIHTVIISGWRDDRFLLCLCTCVSHFPTMKSQGQCGEYAEWGEGGGRGGCLGLHSGCISDQLCDLDNLFYFSLLSAENPHLENGKRFLPHRVVGECMESVSNSNEHIVNTIDSGIVYYYY